ncbi:MaoC family dehydratase [Fulvimarina sp. 2208YS6-2-32]|uniref:MaoC family dehydratase n=1 Tax=Fulvimarina uroteuthidis TaxID=3098149 RepID=A0ABU5I4E9_9HYPH|nr:MaoC family dehydratase [Fulvimarina sp. 2208YS6-2-32]MDY8109628.1 MaoC family dehydratase [Fulvimarina sp. 2208YS6-2-32]
MSFWNTIPLDETYALGSHRFSAEDIIAFAEKFDPQRFHLDPELARQTLFAGHCASGWHTTAVYMKLNVAWRKTILKAWLAGGNPMPNFGPSPGIRNIRWTRPVYAGDTISYSHRVSEKRVSKSKPGWGIIGFAVEARNQDGIIVMTFDGAAFIGTD